MILTLLDSADRIIGKPRASGDDPFKLDKKGVQAL